MNDLREEINMETDKEKNMETDKEKNPEKKPGKPGRRSECLEFLGGIKKLSPMEFEFMKLIWEKPEGISSEEIYHNPIFQQPQGTKSTILFKINEKGYVTMTQRGLHHFYYPKFSRKEYEQAIIKQKLKNSFGHTSILDLVAYFCGKEKLTQEQSDKVNQLMEEIEQS